MEEKTGRATFNINPFSILGVKAHEYRGKGRQFNLRAPSIHAVKKSSHHRSSVTQLTLCPMTRVNPLSTKSVIAHKYRVVHPYTYIHLLYIEGESKSSFVSQILKAQMVTWQFKCSCIFHANPPMHIQTPEEETHSLQSFGVSPSVCCSPFRIGEKAGGTPESSYKFMASYPHVITSCRCARPDLLLLASHWWWKRWQRRRLNSYARKSGGFVDLGNLKQRCIKIKAMLIVILTRKMVEVCYVVYIQIYTIYC